MLRAPLLTALLSWLNLPTFAAAGELQPFDASQFEQLQASGKPIVVVVHATWCPVCKVQLPIQADLMRSPEFRDYTLFTVDFDKDQALLRRFNVVKQSTLIVFNGKDEVARSVGDTNRDSIKAAMLKAEGSRHAGKPPQYPAAPPSW